MFKLKNDYQLTENPILFHLFSNASSFIIYQHVLNEAKKENSPYAFILNNQAGLICDSCPGWPPTQYKQWVIDRLGFDYFSGFLNTLLNDKRENISTLYLYSKSDAVIDPNEIEKFIQQRRKKMPTLSIKTAVYEDAEHVMIYQKYPAEYLTQIREHLILCGLLLNDAQKSKL